MTDVVQPDAGRAQPIASTAYGTVYADRVIFFGKKGWFSGGVQEDIAIRHVTSVKLETSRNIIGAIILIVLGLFFLFGKALGIVIALMLFAWAALLIWGTPTVRIHTAGGESRPARGAPWTKDEAEAYVAGVRKALFDKP